MKIGYLSEPVEEYAKELSSCLTLMELKYVTEKYKRIASDAHKIALQMSANDFIEFRRGLKLERKVQFAGEEWAVKYGAILLPEVMFKVGMVAQRFMVPWGCAFLRMKDAGKIKEDGGIARVV